MTLGRQSFIAFLLLAAVLSLFFYSVAPSHATTTRHHVRHFAATATPSIDLGSASSSPLSSRPAQAVTERSESLLVLHCTRLC